MTLEKTHGPQILLVDDNSTNLQVLYQTLEGHGYRLLAARNGKDAISIAQRVIPDLILLDLNLPRKDGREVLKSIKQDAHLQAIPVVVLTSSDAQRDVAETYLLGANCFVTKPVDLVGFQKIVQTVENFWFTVVKLPGTAAAGG